MTIGDFQPFALMLNKMLLFQFLGCLLLSCLLLIEIVRLVIVIYRSVKGRMDRV